jgi:5-formyltetrahydrofolate cyclo-ligase
LTDKPALRAQALARRSAIDGAGRDAHARAAAIHASPLLDECRGLIVSGYWPIRSEADPRPLLQRAAAAGARLALPVTTPDGLDFRLWNTDEPLVPAGFGTEGPPPTAPRAEPDRIIMPLAAFDRRGHRIGYGQGHYDRAIAAAHAAGRRPLLIGLAFAVQEVEKVPFEPHDIPLDFIVTEEELIAADRG